MYDFEKDYIARLLKKVFIKMVTISKYLAYKLGLGIRKNIKGDFISYPGPTKGIRGFTPGFIP